MICKVNSIESLLSCAYDDLYSEKKNYFLYFLDENISFELWLTVELAMHLKKMGCEVNFTPRVMVRNSDIEKGNEYRFLDLFVSNGIEKCIIELKIAMPATQDKYKNNCRDDIKKLSNVIQISKKDLNLKDVKKLFVLFVISSREENQFNNKWSEWLNEIFETKGDDVRSLINYSKFPEVDRGDLSLVVYHKYVSSDNINSMKKITDIINKHRGAFSILSKL